MAVSWPVTLQQNVNEQSFSLEKGETVLRSEMDVGPIKVRRRFTRSIDKLTVSVNLTTSQYNDLEVFYNTTTNAGTIRFELLHPITGILTEFRFAQPPSYRSIGGGNFQATMQWEIMPAP